VQREAASPPYACSSLRFDRITEKSYHPSPRLSQFINLVGGSNQDVSSGLQSCTNTVQVVEPFELDGRPVVLIDTPGFDDTTQSDTDILRMIAAFLEAS